MGGTGSGSRRRFSDEERKRRGTYREDESEAAIAARLTARVVTGPWIVDRIPEPTLPLSDAGRKKYDDLTRLLFGQGKLTEVTLMWAQAAAVLWGKIHALLSEGKQPSASDWTQFQRALSNLQVAENAPTIADPGKKNKFAKSGWANRKDAEVRLSRPAASSA